MHVLFSNVFAKQLTCYNSGIFLTCLRGSTKKEATALLSDRLMALNTCKVDLVEDRLSCNCIYTIFAPTVLFSVAFQSSLHVFSIHILS